MLFHRCKTAALVSLSVAACGKQTGHVAKQATPYSIVSPDEMQLRMDIVNEKYNASQVCEDYEVAIQTMALMQAPKVGASQVWSESQLHDFLSACPTSFSELVLKLSKTISSFEDGHTGLYVGNSLDLSAPSVVVRCLEEECQEYAGAPVLPLRTDVQGKLYAVIPTQGKTNVFAIESLNGKKLSDLIKSLQSSNLLSSVENGSTSDAVYRLLQRKMLDSRDRNDLVLELRDVVSQRKLKIVSSFLADQSIFVEIPQELEGTVNAYRTYGCEEFEGDLSSIGGCVTNKGRLVLWAQSWKPGKVTSFVSSFLEKHHALMGKGAGPVLFDLRNNSGGSTREVADFLCTFGDTSVQQELQARALVAGLSPSAFVTSQGSRFLKADLKVDGNSELWQEVSGWEVSPASPDSSRRASMTSLLQRLGTNPTDCLKKKSAFADDLRWVLLTNGREFSAAETFLSFLKASPQKFHIMGATTSGATGFPVTLALPHTKVRIRLSMAREMDGKGRFLIQDTGVEPNELSEIDTASDFEARIQLKLSGNNISPLNSGTIPIIVQKAFLR